MQHEDTPRGLYEAVVTQALAAHIARAEETGAHVERVPLDSAEAPERIGHHLGRALTRILAAVPSGEEIRVAALLARDVLDAATPYATDPALVDPLANELQVLLAVLDPAWFVQPPPRPAVPLADHDLLVMGRGEPRIGTEIRKEIASADRVDLLCAFITWPGLRVLAEALRDHVRAGRRVRVITTTYMGATERRALDELARLGAEVKVSYDTQTTRLHAKAWLFHRETGFATGYVGSSNLSRAALLDGLEWNVRLSAYRSPALLAKFSATFDAYWASDEFEPYDPERDGERFARAVDEAAHDRTARIDLSGLELRPWPYQQEILEALHVERERHGRTRNLVVAATGTGKTVVAALDYKRLRERHGDLSLLFVAHRREILEQSRRTFAEALRDGAFGELLVAGAQPVAGRHVFASIQSLHAARLAEIPPDSFDVVIVDEFHHAEAPSYRWLLGLTATPERADGESILGWFDDRIAFEMRLWDALDQQLLCPFQYFGVADGVDLDGLGWKRGGYDSVALDRVYTGNDARSAKVLEALHRIVGDAGEMRALAFCVSVAHARYMADVFRRAGIPSVAVTGQTPAAERDAALRDLRERTVNVVFTVDLFNEGVDVPEVDTILLLRPTESATVFLQQLGRGLRRWPDKRVCTVLDFIGQQHRRFRFDLRYRALMGGSRERVRRAVEDDFPFLPAGCDLQLDRVAKDIVLENVRGALQTTRRTLVPELVELVRERGDVSLATFLDATGIELHEVWKPSVGGWTALRRAAGLTAPGAGPEDERLARRVPALLHLDDPERLELLLDLVTRPGPFVLDALDERRRRLVAMFSVLLWTGADRPSSWQESLDRLTSNAGLLADLVEVSTLLEDRAERLTEPARIDPAVPLHVHATYARDEILAAFGAVRPGRRPGLPAGVWYDGGTDTDVLLVTLRKSERDYSPTTMYDDYAISPELFHWESQGATSQSSPAGRRYLATNSRPGQVLLFVRETKRGPGGTSVPYLLLGPCRLVEARGDRPIAITWRLDRPMPRTFFQRAKAAAS
jgi:superfamily II DNA or RNA helicase